MLRGGDLHILLIGSELGDLPRLPGLEHRWLLDDPYRVVIPTTWPLPLRLDDLAAGRGSVVSQGRQSNWAWIEFAAPAAWPCSPSTSAPNSPRS